MKHLLLAFVFCLLATAQSQVIYTVQDLGTLGGATSSGLAVNAAGQVAGASDPENDEPSRAFVTGVDGTSLMQDLGTLGGSTSSGQAINAHGQVAGSSTLSGGSFFPHAFLSTTTGGGLLDLGTLGGPGSIAYGVNGAGQVAGESQNSSGLTRAFLSEPGGGPLRDLGALPGGQNSRGRAVNASGQATGYADTTNEFQAIVNHAFLSETNGGPLRDLGTLGGSYSFANAVNDSGQVVGRSENASGTQHAFRSEPNGGPLLDLGSLGGTSIGQGINNAGTVVGYFLASGTFNARAFVYSTSYGMLDLNLLIAPDAGWLLTDAKGINDQGQITGTGISEGKTHAYLLQPVPAIAKDSSISKAADGHFIVKAIGTPYRIYAVEVTSSLDTDFQVIANVTPGSDGVIRYEDAATGQFRRFYRFVFDKGRIEFVSSSHRPGAPGKTTGTLQKRY